MFLIIISEQKYYISVEKCKLKLIYYAKMTATSYTTMLSVLKSMDVLAGKMTPTSSYQNVGKFTYSKTVYNLSNSQQGRVHGDTSRLTLISPLPALLPFFFTSGLTYGLDATTCEKSVK